MARSGPAGFGRVHSGIVRAPGEAREIPRLLPRKGGLRSARPISGPRRRLPPSLPCALPRRRRPWPAAGRRRRRGSAAQAAEGSGGVAADVLVRVARGFRQGRHGRPRRGPDAAQRTRRLPAPVAVRALRGPRATRAPPRPRPAPSAPGPTRRPRGRSRRPWPAPRPGRARPPAAAGPRLPRLQAAKPRTYGSSLRSAALAARAPGARQIRARQRQRRLPAHVLDGVAQATNNSGAAAPAWRADRSAPKARAAPERTEGLASPSARRERRPPAGPRGSGSLPLERPGRRRPCSHVGPRSAPPRDRDRRRLRLPPKCAASTSALARIVRQQLAFRHSLRNAPCAGRAQVVVVDESVAPPSGCSTGSRSRNGNALTAAEVLDLPLGHRLGSAGPPPGSETGTARRRTGAVLPGPRRGARATSSKKRPVGLAAPAASRGR